MLKKSAIVAVLSGAAILTGGVAATMASAAPAESPVPSVGDDFCPAPWQWNGPGVVGLSGESTSYEACGGSSVESTEGLVNGACLLPWQWNGPFNALLTENATSYAACNE